jgi:hypothetical protein
VSNGLEKIAQNKEHTMARTPISDGVRINVATVSAGADVTHYHYQAVGEKWVGFVKIPLFAEIEVARDGTAEAQENAIIGAVNEIAGDL